MKKCPYSEQREKLVAEAISPVATELRLLDAADLIALLRFERFGNLSDLVASAAELYFLPGLSVLAPVGTTNSIGEQSQKWCLISKSNHRASLFTLNWRFVTNMPELRSTISPSSNRRKIRTKTHVFWKKACSSFKIPEGSSHRTRCLEQRSVY